MSIFSPKTCFFLCFSGLVHPSGIFKFSKTHKISRFFENFEIFTNFPFRPTLASRHRCRHKPHIGQRPSQMVCFCAKCMFTMKFISFEQNKLHFNKNHALFAWEKWKILVKTLPPRVEFPHKYFPLLSATLGPILFCLYEKERTIPKF